jgi:natural product precursor
MKKLQKLRLNVLNEQNLAEKQMNSLRGGATCFCSCYYANYGGSSTNANMMANYNSVGDFGSYHSTNGCNQYVYDGNMQYCPDCNESNQRVFYYDC